MEIKIKIHKKFLEIKDKLMNKTNKTKNKEIVKMDN